jgi:hypothetical protein
MHGLPIYFNVSTPISLSHILNLSHFNPQVTYKFKNVTNNLLCVQHISLFKSFFKLINSIIPILFENNAYKK